MKKLLLMFTFIFLLSINVNAQEVQETVNVAFQSIEVTDNFYKILAGPRTLRFFIDYNEIEIEKIEPAGGALYSYYYIPRISGDELRIEHDEDTNYRYTPRTVDISEFKNYESNNCIDTDGIDYYTVGSVIINPYFDGNKFVTKDNCGKGRYEGYVIEYTCNLNDNGDTYIPNNYKCPNGCSEGVCVKVETTLENGPIDILEVTEEETIEGTKVVEVTEEETEIICSGCVLDNKCYPFGYRKDGNFCFDEFEKFVSQKEADTICENNFECTTNLCIDGNCVSSGTWQKFLAWFKKIFG